MNIDFLSIGVRVIGCPAGLKNIVDEEIQAINVIHHDLMQSAAAVFW